jgi:glycosyltransferase involved in cell wall biosynthesis
MTGRLTTRGMALVRVAEADTRVKLHRHEVNRGKGAAVRTGFSLVKAPVAIVQDADLEYDPEDYEVLLGPILANKADVEFGSRFQGSGGAPNFLLLACCRQPLFDHAFQHGEQSQPYGYGNRLQNVPARGCSKANHRGEAVWLRA